MRSALAITIAFCLAFPLSAVAASGHRLSLKPGCTGVRNLTERLACLCVLHGGEPVIFPGGVTCYTRFTKFWAGAAESWPATRHSRRVYRQPLRHPRQ